MTWDMITLTCGSVDIRDVDGNEKPHELRNAAGECRCKDGSIVDYVPDADYLGMFGFADWPVHVWVKGGSWLPVHPPKDQTDQALPLLGPIGPVQIARAIAEYEHEPYVPANIGPPPPIEIPAWDPIDPAPEITTRTGFMAPMPAVVAKLARTAREAGFEVRCGYARARVRAVRIGTYRTSESWSVQGRGPGLFTAVQERNPDGKTGWKWDRISCSLAGTTFPYASITDLGAWIEARGEPGDLWRRAILNRVNRPKAPARARAKAQVDGG